MKEFRASSIVNLQIKQPSNIMVSILSETDRLIVNKGFYNMHVTETLHYIDQKVSTAYTGYYDAPNWLRNKLGNTHFTIKGNDTADFSFCTGIYNFNIRTETDNLKLKDSYDHLNILKEHQKTIRDLRNRIKSIKDIRQLYLDCEANEPLGEDFISNDVQQLTTNFVISYDKFIKGTDLRQW